MTECLIASFYKWSEPVARKEYKCCECYAPIMIGEKHFSAIGSWDGEFSNYRQHLLCSEACMFIRDNYNEFECIAFGDLFDYYWEFRLDIDRHSEKGKTFRAMMAKIKWRQRKHRRKK